MSDKADRFMEFLNEPAEDDPAAEIAAWTQFMCCPGCGAEYPDFHSIAGALHTLCDECGWSSEDGAGQ